MRLRRPSRTARPLVQRVPLGLALLFAGVLTGCSGAPSRLSVTHNDTGWQTSSTYASATSEMSPRTAVRSTRVHLCDGAVCSPPVTSQGMARSNRRAM